MKKIVFPLAGIVLLLTSCDDNTKNVAEGMCDCYGKSDVKFSAASKKVLGKLVNSADPMKTYQAEIEKLDEEDQVKVGEEMQQASLLSEDADVKACVNKIDEKYKVRGKDEKTALKKVVEHMKTKGGNCEAWAGLINLGLQAQDANALQPESENAVDDTETPKKKKASDEEEL